MNQIEDININPRVTGKSQGKGDPPTWVSTIGIAIANRTIIIISN